MPAKIVRPLLLVLLAFLALHLRLQNIELYALNSDEGMFYEMASQPSLEKAWLASLKHASPPLYTILAYINFWFFGTNVFNARLVSVITGSLTIIPIGLIAFEFSGLFALITACLIYAFLPSSITMAQLARPYALQHLFTATSLFLAFANISKTSKLRNLLPISLSLLLLTHYTSVIPIGAILLAIELPNFLSANKDIIQTLKTRLKYYYPLTVTVIFLSVTHIIPAITLGAYGNGRVDWLEPLLISSFDGLISNILNAYSYLIGEKASISLIPLGALILLTPLNNYAKSFGVVIVLSCLLSSLRIFPFGGCRHISYYAVYLAIIGGIYATEYLKLLKNKKFVRAIVVSMFTIVTLTTSYKIPNTQTKNTSLSSEYQVENREALETIASLKESTHEEDLIFFMVQSFYTLLPILRDDLTKNDDYPKFLYKWKGRYIILLGFGETTNYISGEELLDLTTQRIHKSYKKLPYFVKSKANKNIFIISSHTFEKSKWFEELQNQKNYKGLETLTNMPNIGLIKVRIP